MSEGEVVRAARKFIRSIDPDDLERLPPHCRGIAFEDVAGLARWAYVMAHDELIGATDGRAKSLVYVISLVLASASARVAAIQHARRATNAKLA